YAAFFAIGAYSYGILSSYQVTPLWSEFWEPFQWLGLVEQLKDSGTDGDLVHFTFSFWLMLPLSALIAAFFGVLFGAPTLRLNGDPRGRDRRRRDGRQSGQAEAARLRHRRRLRRVDRHALRRQAADRDPGNVHVPGLGHGARHDRARRHGQHLRRHSRRLDPA